MSIVTPNTGDGNISYNYNKYCFSVDKNIYTRYYYTNLQDGNEIKISTSDGNESYWLYKPNSTWPNAGTTNFVESVRVILGGGETFYDKDDLNGNHQIGTISCQ